MKKEHSLLSDQNTPNLDVQAVQHNLESLRAYLDSKTAIFEQRFVEISSRTEALAAATKEAAALALNSSKDAARTAKIASDERFDVVDRQARSTPQRPEVDAQILRLTDKVTDLTTQLAAKSSSSFPDRIVLLIATAIIVAAIIVGFMYRSPPAGGLSPAAIAVVPLKPQP